VNATPSQAEREFLVRFNSADGIPVMILGHGLDEPALAKLQAMALSVVQQGLAGIYGRPDDARDVPLPEAEAIILEPRNWVALEHDELWMIATTEAGEALLGAADER
jgi:hypothetical protein